jgi:PBP1b-binding outer membrane lipoprotein LpoB
VKNLSRLLMVLLLVLMLNSCQTVPIQQSRIEIPELNIRAPSRPVLVEIPDEPIDAIRSLTLNLSILEGYVRLLEMYSESIREYFISIVTILNQA